MKARDGRPEAKARTSSSERDTGRAKASEIFPGSASERQLAYTWSKLTKYTPYPFPEKKRMFCAKIVPAIA